VHSPYGERVRSRDTSTTKSACGNGDCGRGIRRYRDFLQRACLPKAREALGVSANPNGRECYAALLRQFSTVPITPDEVYAQGQQQIR